MLQTIQGYFQEDIFIPLQQVEIPNYVEVFIVVTNKPVLVDDLKTDSDKAISSFPLFGCAKNKGGWMSDDFDAPLEEMEVYM